MKIECLVIRPGGSEISLPDMDEDGRSVVYSFTGPEGGPHVAEVEDQRHVDMLARNAHFRVVAEAKPKEEPKPDPKPAPGPDQNPGDGGSGEPDKAALDAARARYAEVLGKNPFNGWPVEELEKRIAAYQKASGEAGDPQE